MKTFLAIYLGSMTSPGQVEWNKLDEATRQKKIAAGMKGWGDWMATHKAALVFEGGPFGKTKRASCNRRVRHQEQHVGLCRRARRIA